MKVIRHDKYCRPDELKLEDLDKPTPKDNAVLVKVHASPVNSIGMAWAPGNGGSQAAVIIEASSSWGTLVSMAG